jgi:hypothetical protein
MKIERLSFSGTAEEFKQVAHLFARQAEEGEALAAPAHHEASPDTVRVFVRQLLTRRRIANGQLAIFKALYDAGDEGLSKAKLAEATNRTEKQIHGVMGALGRRVNATGGIGDVHPGGGMGALLETRPFDGELRYTMRLPLRKALEELKIVATRPAN